MSGTFSFPPPPPPPASRPASATHVLPRNDNGRGRDHQTRHHGRGRGSVNHNPRLDSSSRGRGDDVTQTSSRHAGYSGGAPSRPSWNDSASSPKTSQSANDNSRYLLDRSAAGHKRKLEAFKSVQTSSPREPSTRVTAPTVPRFGTVAVPRDSRQHFNVPQKPRAQNSLGLTPASIDSQLRISEDVNTDDSEPGEDVDEEALYAEMGPSLTFEYNGEILSLKTASDLIKWQQQRKQNWPSNARIARRADERLKNGIERRRLLSDAARQLRNGDVKALLTRKVPHTFTTTEQRGLHATDTETAEPSNEESEREKLQRVLTERSAELKGLQAGLRKKQRVLDDLRKEISGDAPSHALSIEGEQAQDLPAEIKQTLLRAANEIDGGSPASSLLSDSSVMSSDDEEDDDDQPEEATSKWMTTESSDRPICRFFLSPAGCREGITCPFRHDQAQRDISVQLNRERAKPTQKATAPTIEKSSRSGIHDALLEQQRKEEDRLAIKVIEYLGQNGLFT